MRLIDADILADEIESLKVSIAGRPATWAEVKADVLQVIDDQKTVNAVDVVRCKDCKYSYAFPPRYLHLYCERLSSIGFAPEVNTDDFCSYGERKSDDGK